MKPNFATSAVYNLDNLEVMRGMDSATVRLIYADPPFNSKRIYQGMSGTKAAPHRFRDTWSWNDAKQEWLDELEADHPVLHRVIHTAKAAHSGSMGGYLAFMAVRVIEMHRVLKPTGSLYLHCDSNANAYLRTLLDAVFGEKQLRNEIVWKRTTSHSNGTKRYGTITDTILFYAKSKDALFIPPRQERSKTELREYRPHPQTGRLYKTNDLTSPSPTPSRMFEWRGTNPGNGWRYSLAKLEQLYAEGRIKTDKEGKPLKRGHIQYLDEMKNPLVQNLWADIEKVGNTAKERRGWATQKPEALLERIINASSNAGDIVFDPFCGCGTAPAVAERLGRRWVGADDDVNAIDEVRDRIAELRAGSDTQPALKRPVSVLYDPPTRTVQADGKGVLRDPTGVVVRKLPSDKLTQAQVRVKLLEFQAEPDGAVICPGCGNKLPERYYHVDHIDPKSTGGSNHITNRILLCGACNGEKSDTGTLSALHQRHNLPRRKAQQRVKRIRDAARAYAAALDAAHPALA